MARIVTKNGVSVSTAVPKNKTTTKSGVTGVSVGEIQGSKKAPVVTTPAAPTKPVNTKPIYRSVNGKVVDVNKPKIPTKVDPTSTKGQVTYVQDESINTNGGLMDQKGNYNMDYIPQTLEELTNIPDPNTRNYLMANYYKSKGLDFNTEGLAKNYDEAAQLFIEGQKEEMSALDKEIAYAKKTASDRLKASTGAVKNQFAQSREGQVSAGNTAVAQETNVAMTEEVGRQFDQMSQQKRQLEKLQQQQQTEYSEGRAAQIAQLQQNVADAEANLAETQSKQAAESLALIKELNSAGALAGLDEIGIANLQAALGGLPEGVVNMFANAATQKNLSEGSKAKWEKMNTALNTFKGLAAEGIQITPEMMLETAQQTGMPLEALMAFNQKAGAVMQDKSLDSTKKLGEIQKLGLELDRQARGVTNAELEKVDYLENLYRSGASQAEIQRFKRMVGMKDEDDPMYRLDLEKKALDNQMQSILNKYIEPEKLQELTKNALDITGKEFDNIIKEVEANGASEREILELEKLRIDKKLKDQELLDKVGSEVITSPGKYKMEADQATGGLKINAKAGAWAGQCGHFVNDVFGERIVGDSFQQKMSLTDPNIKDPTPGMAFVMPVSGKAAPYGHIGIVLKDNGNGTVNIVDSNWGNDEKIQYRTISKSKISGYIPPPLGQSQHIAPKVTASANLEELADTIMSPTSSLTLKDIPEKDRGALANILNKRKEEAIQSGDILGIVRASAGGKELDATALQSLDKARMVKSQLDNLANSITGTTKNINGVDIAPLWGVVQSNNPYDTKAQLIKAQLRAIVPNLARGVYGEVGVLTDHDIENYIQTIPNLSSTKDVRDVLVRMTNEIVGESIKTKLDTQARAGRDVSGFADVLLELDPTLKNKQQGIQAKQFNLFDPSTWDYRNQVVEDSHLSTGQYSLPEDSTAVEYTY